MMEVCFRSFSVNNGGKNALHSLFIIFYARFECRLGHMKRESFINNFFWSRFGTGVGWDRGFRSLRWPVKRVRKFNRDWDRDDIP